MTELGRQVLANQPFSRLLGAALTRLSASSVELRLPVRDELKQQHGFVHGGVASYLADNALTFAGGAAFGGDVLTAEFKINYTRPALGDALVARATVVSRGKTQAVVRCDVFAVHGTEEKLCAAAQGTIVRLQSATG